MSGTSVDSVDAALARFHSSGPPTLVAGHRHPLPGDIRLRVLALFGGEAASPAAIGQLDVRLGRLFALAAKGALKEAGVRPRMVRAIGSHGQTVHHAPGVRYPFTWQLGDPNVIAERTGITTVADFRRRDVAAGGQGAPLAPAFHAAVLRDPDDERVVLNLGGIANVTVLPRAGGAVEPAGFDTGPANCLLDGWTARHLGAPMDQDGRWARSGQLHQALLERMLADPYFAKHPPKSTGREHFSLRWLDQRLAQRSGKVVAADVARTLCELTAASVRDAVSRWARDADTVLVCGGGARNAFLMERLTALLAPRRVTTTDVAGVNPNWMECLAFAWLARAALAGQAGNLPAVTGARHPVVLGAVYPGRAKVVKPPARQRR